MVREVTGWGQHWNCPARRWACLDCLDLSLPTFPFRAFLAAALAQGLCEVLLVVTKEVEETGCWLRTS